MLVVRLGEVLDVVLEPLDLALHVGQAGLQDLSGHCGEREKQMGVSDSLGSVARPRQGDGRTPLWVFFGEKGATAVTH